MRQNNNITRYKFSVKKRIIQMKCENCMFFNTIPIFLLITGQSTKKSIILLKQKLNNIYWF